MSIRIERYFAAATLFATLTLFGGAARAQTTENDAAPTPASTPASTADATTDAPDAASIEDEAADERAGGDASARAVRALSDPDPQRRQSAAETLARLAPPDNRRLVQGYRLQERDPRVRLALDWALYRLGKPDALFGVVGALDSKRREQAIEYLARLEDPTTLVALLKSPKRAIKTGALEAIGRVGTEETARSIEPLRASPDLEVAAAAQFALTQIEIRQGRKANAPVLPTRPRQVGMTPKSGAQ